MKPVKIAISVILALAVFVSVDSLRAEESGERLGVEDCLALAKKYAGKSEGWDRVIANKYIGKTHVWIDRYDAAMTFANSPEINFEDDPTGNPPGRNRRDELLAVLARESADRGEHDFAIKYAREIRDSERRERSFCALVSIAAEQYEFDRGLSILATIVSEEEREQAAMVLFDAQMDAGKYAQAQETCETFFPEYRKSPALKRLNKAMNKGVTYPRKKPTTTITERVRWDCMPLWWAHYTIGNGKANGIDFRTGDADKDTVLAWALYLENDIPQCRDVLRQTSNLLENVDSDILKMHTAVMICDLSLECNEEIIYSEICEKYFTYNRLVINYLEIYYKDHPKDLAFYRYPQIVMVLVRVQRASLAIEFLNKSAEYYKHVKFDESWWVLGYTSALTGQIDTIREHSQEIKTDLQKSLLYSGMAAGLYERQQANKP